MKDEWIRAAMTDESLVAELLLRLKDSDSHPSSRISRAMAAAASISSFPLEWGMRQPRSKAPASTSTAEVPTSKKEAEPATRSPTTPLSWSGGGGRSGGGASPSDEYEESSLPSDPFPDVRSKGTGTAKKRTRRKKTFAELKEEESSLLKERAYLKKEIATLHVTLKEQRSLNHSLKRMKIDFHVESRAKKWGPTMNESVAQNSAETSSYEQPKHITWNDHPLPESCPADENAGDKDQVVFALPDLNMLPRDD
ncbi:hypothetical protein Dimus_010155 [Dionaea muscipula]